ncbi:MAG: DUF489 family protein [Succinivibrio sp.]|nr:DUF489 family protein [Succinivibrio sp.]
MANIKSEAIALSALFQCCTQIYRIANTGYYDDAALACVLRSVLVTNPKTVEDIYPQDKLKVGFAQLSDSFGKSISPKTMENIEITKMALKVISLTITLLKNNKVLNRLSDEIDELSKTIPEQYENFFEGSPEVVNQQSTIRLFGTLYKSIISPNFPKLLICGKESCLSIVENQEKIRALLLCAIRAVILWRQVGGRRRYLFFRRAQIVEYTQAHS